MYLRTFYQNYSVAAVNQEILKRSPAKMIDDAVSGIINNGAFDFAECSVTEGAWTGTMAADYLVSKAIGFIDLEYQDLLKQDLYNIILMHINC